MANLIVCCDGTWNTPDDLDGGLPAPTNVVRLYNALAEAEADGTRQRKYYHPGVGTDGNAWDRIAGGGMGEGLDRGIKSAYKWLGTNYRPGDHIFLFGFSRGAYTVRSLAGMITACGLADLSDLALDPDQGWTCVDNVFDCYRAVPKGKPTCALHSGGPAPGMPVNVHFLGVWDTVGALGVPDDLALLNIIDDPRARQFHDTNLNDRVEYARHAVAIDELRASFAPTLWTNAAEHGNARQVWFPGVHSDVGGGYGQTGLSDGALKWMIDEAADTSDTPRKDGRRAKKGLTFRSGAMGQIRPNPRSVLHDSRTGIFKALRSHPRSTPRVDEAAVQAGGVHLSAFERQANPPLDQPPYWPTHVLDHGGTREVEIFARQLWNNTGIHLEAGRRYALKARGQWLDGKSVKCGPGGTADGTFQIGEIVQLASSAVGRLEGLFQRLTANKQAEIWGTKREEDLPWFALVGVVANGIGVDEDGNPVKHETFLVGNGVADFTPQNGSGYLYCFANDTWQTYENNAGSVTLEVRCIG